MAGKGGGRRDQELCVRCALELAAGADRRAEFAEQCEDGRSILVVEPLRWALAVRPQWIALEQVPPVLEMWTLFAQILAEHGYGTWAGVLSAERYGVPQTRRRAIMLAQLGRTPQPPPPTHQAYVPGEAARGEDGLFGSLAPWVSMAEALGWDTTGDAPSPTVTSGAHGDIYASSASRDRVQRSYRLARGEGMVERHGERRETPDTEPAPAITGSRRSRDGMLVGRQLPDGEGVNVGGRNWTEGRPATSVTTDPRIFQPGGHHQPGQQSQNAIRVTEQEAAVLQCFPADYPWQGSRSSRFQQIGNAICPPLALAILTAVTEGLR